MSKLSKTWGGLFTQKSAGTVVCPVTGAVGEAGTAQHIYKNYRRLGSDSIKLPLSWQSSLLQSCRNKNKPLEETRLDILHACKVSAKK